MSNKAFWIIIILFILTIFILIPMMSSGEDEGEGFEQEDGMDIDYHKSKSARSVGGSRSYRSGK